MRQYLRLGFAHPQMRFVQQLRDDLIPICHLHADRAARSSLASVRCTCRLISCASPSLSMYVWSVTKSLVRPAPMSAMRLPSGLPAHQQASFQLASGFAASRTSQ